MTTPDYDALLAGRNEPAPVDYDALLASPTQSEPGRAARAGFALAADTNPDAYAEAQRVARRANLPVETVLNQPAKAKRLAAIGTIDFDALSKTSPTTAALLADVEKARIAHDDVGNLGEIERKLRQFGGGAVEAVGMSVSGAFNLLDVGARAIDRPVRSLLGDAVADLFWYEPTAYDPLAVLRKSGEYTKSVARDRLMIPADQRTFADDVAGGLGQVAGQIAMLPFLRGVGLYTQGADVMAEKVKDDPASPATKDLAIVGGATITGVTEKWALDRLLGPLAVPIKNQTAAALARIGIAGAAEGGQEFAENVLHDTLRQMLTDPDAEVEWGQSAYEGGVGATVGGIVRSIVEAGLHIRARGARGERQAEQGAELLDSLNKMAAADKLLARDPDTFEQFVAAAAENGPVQQVFIDANTLMQSGLAEQLAAASPAVAEQLAEASQTGGQIAIPVEEYAARIAPTDAAQSLLDHLKTEPEGFSRAEAQEYMQSQAEELRADVERTLRRHQGDDAFRDSADVVRTAVKTQLDTAGRFSPQVNDAYSTLVGNFYAVQAARLGVTPEEMFQQYPLRVTAGGAAGGRRFDQDDGPFDEGPFGPVLRDYQADANGAIAKLLEMRSGEAIGALNHPEIGDIDLVWGEEGTGASDGYGLAKLAKWHPEVLGDLQGILSTMRVTSRGRNRVRLESADHRASVRLTWDSQAKQWLLTAFQKRGDVAGTRTDTTGLGVEGGTARLDDASDAIVDQKIDRFYQSKRGPRGSFDPATNTIALLQNADLSTFLHESGHFFLEVQFDMAAKLAGQRQAGGEVSEGQASVLQDAQATLDWFGVRDLTEWYGLDFEQKRGYHEQFARGFEAYLFEGTAPSFEMQGVFQRFRAWLLNVYRDLRALNVELTPEVRGVFDRMLATGEQISLAEQGRSMMPLFATAEQAGMTAQEFAAYQALGIDATNDAIQDLQARSLRDMQWLHNARSRILKQLQQRAESQRSEVRMEARREVMTQPVYRAWQFLTGRVADADRVAPVPRRKSDPNVVDETQDSLFAAIGKLGGIRKADAVREWGLDPAERIDSGVFGKPVLRANGGLSLDEMRQALAERGYLDSDESNPDWNPREFEERFDLQLGGNEQYSNAYDYAAAQDVRAGDQIANPGALRSGRLDIGELRAIYGSASPAVQQATPERAATSLDEARAKAQAFIGKPLENRATKLKATVSKGTLRKMTSAKAVTKSTSGAYHALAVANVDKLFENAVLDSSRPDTRGEKTIVAIHRFVAPMVAADGEVLAVKLTVKETQGPNEPNPLYTVETLKIEKPALRASPAGEIERGIGVDDVATTATGGFSENVRRRLDSVKVQVDQGTMLINALQARHMTAAGGLHPDIVAELTGFDSGDELVRAVAVAVPPNEAIETLTDQRMLERHGELSSPAAIERAADAAIHNEARARFVATEAQALDRAAAGPTRQIGTDQSGRPVMRRVLPEAAQAYARAAVARVKVRHLRPGQYAGAAERAARNAERAMRDGNIAKAAAEKRNQTIQHALAHAAHEAQTEMENLRSNWSDIAARSDASVSKAYDVDMFNAVRAILGQYGIAPARGRRAMEYLARVREYDPQTYAMVESSVLLAEANAKPFRDMTVVEARGLSEDIGAILHLARRSRQMEVDGDLIDIEEAEQALQTRMEAYGVPDSQPGEKSAITPGEMAMSKLRTAIASSRRVESWVGQMDGTQAMGPFRRYLWNPVREAADAYRTDKAVHMRTLRNLLDSIAPTLKPMRIHAPELGGYTFGMDSGNSAIAEILHALLHTGNDSNKRKLLLGRGWATELENGVLDTTGWNAFINRLAAEGHITKAHFDFVQGVWDLMESLKPQAQRAHRDVFGRYFNEVTAVPLSTPFGIYRGGYVPAKVDARIVGDAAMRELAESENASMAFSFPSTSRGFTMGRVEYNRPLMLDLRTLAQHIDQVLLFSHMEMPVRSAQRVLRRVGGTLNRIDSSVVGAMLTPWLNRAARQQVVTPISADAGLSRFFSVLRSRAGAAAMFANITNTLQQITGFSLAAVKVKPRLMVSATADYLKAPRQFTDAVANASPFMADRMQNQISAMTDDINEILLNPSSLQQAQNWTMRHAYFMQQGVDNVMSPIIWTAAYNQAMEQGQNHRDAVRLADSAVRETQGSQLPEDMSRIESGNAFVRMFTQFAGYFNMQANLLGTEFAKIAKEYGLRDGAARGFYVFAAGFLIPAVMSELIVQIMRGGPEDDDDDGYLDDWIAALSLGVLRNGTAMVPVAGPMVGAAINAWNDKPYDDRLATAPAISMIESAMKAGPSTWRAISGDGPSQKAVRDVGTLISMSVGLPANVAARPVGYMAAIADDRVEPTGPVDFVRGLLTGAASPESR